MILFRQYYFYVYNNIVGGIEKMYNKITRRKKYGKLRKTKNRTKRRKTNMRATRKQKRLISRRISRRTRSMKGGYDLVNFKKVIDAINTPTDSEITNSLIDHDILLSFSIGPGEYGKVSNDEIDESVRYVLRTFYENPELKDRILQKIREIIKENYPVDKERILSKIDETEEVFNKQKQVREQKQVKEQKQPNPDNLFVPPAQYQPKSFKPPASAMPSSSSIQTDPPPIRKKTYDEKKVRKQEEENDRIQKEQEEENDRIQKEEEMKRRQQEEEMERQRLQDIEKQRVIYEDNELRQRGPILPENISTISFMDYDKNDEPKFWQLLFKPRELLQIRRNLLKMIKDKTICNLIKEIIPTYISALENEQANIRLCSIMLIYGLLSKKLKYEKYTLLFKGGKAIQMVLSELYNPNKEFPFEYTSTDIDIIITPKQDIPYNMHNLQLMAEHIRELIGWLSSDPNDNFSNKIFVAQISPEHNQSIVKISLNSRPVIPLTDIDFKEIIPEIKPFFYLTHTISHNTSVFGEILFTYPMLDSLINEKIFFLIYYINLHINDHLQDFHLNKIYKGLYPLLSALLLKENPELNIADLPRLQEQKLKELLEIYLIGKSDTNQIIQIILIRMFHIPAINIPSEQDFALLRNLKREFKERNHIMQTFI